MEAATGSADQGAAELDFVRKTSETLGLDLLTTAEAYTKLAAASKGTAMEGQAARDIFTSVASASTTLGLSAEQTAGALTAIQQMISKGNVSAEELRGQLGERLPGAFNIAARAMGVTTMELDKMLKKGEVVTADFLPKFADELTKSFGASEKATNSAQAALNRFNTSVFEMKQAIVDNGGSDAVKDLAHGMTGLVNITRDGILYIKEMKVHWADMFKTAGIIMNGGTLGSNWWTKSGRAEIKAELDAQQKLYEWNLEKISEQRSGLVRARTFPATPTAGAGTGGAGGTAAARAAASRTPASFFGKAWDDSAAALSFEELQSTGFSTDMTTGFGQRNAAPFSILGPGGATAWLAQAESDRETKLAFENELMALDYEMFLSNEERKRREKEITDRLMLRGSMQYTSATANLFGSLYEISGKKLKAFFYIQQTANAAGTMMSGYRASIAALEPPPIGLGPVYGVPLAALTLAGAAAAAVSIMSQSPGGPAGGVSGVAGSASSGLGTPTSPVVTQPLGSTAGAVPSIHIEIHGNVIGEDRWVEERLAPTIRELSGRNVSFGFVPA
jgi:tape measure domain-containing protein